MDRAAAESKGAGPSAATSTLKNVSSVVNQTRAELLLDLEALEVELESEFVGANRWRVHLDPGPHQMLVSGQWDATGQLLANHAALQATAHRLPYLVGFSAG